MLKMWNLRGEKPLLSQTTAHDDLIVQWEDIDKFTAVLQLSLVIAAAVVFIYLFIIFLFSYFFSSSTPPGLLKRSRGLQTTRWMAAKRRGPLHHRHWRSTLGPWTDVDKGGEKCKEKNHWGGPLTAGAQRKQPNVRNFPEWVWRTLLKDSNGFALFATKQEAIFHTSPWKKPRLALVYYWPGKAHNWPDIL